MSASPEVLEVRQVLSAATLSATLVNGLLTVSDTSQSSTNNSLTAMMVGTDLVISDANEQFIVAPAGGALSNGGKTLTIPANLVTVGLTIDAGAGNDLVDIESIDAAFSANLIVDGESGTDTVTFQSAAVNVGGGSVNVAAEFINVNTPLTAGGAVNLSSTGDDTPLTISAGITAGANSTFSADKMSIGSTVTVSSHTLTLQPGAVNGYTDAINIGSTSDLTVNTLELSNAELNRITAQLIVIGKIDAAEPITISAAIEHAGDSSFAIFTKQQIVFLPGSGWATHNGHIEFTANPQGTFGGAYAGVDLNDATISSSGQGNITLIGSGGNQGPHNIGIFAHNGSVIQSTGTGKITLYGVGGNGSSWNRGVEISDAGTSITSVAGAIQITGKGGAGTGDQNFGVWVCNTAVISATGSASVTIDGTGGSGANDNNGIVFNAYGSGGGMDLTVENGDLTLIGHGSTTATGSGNRGIAIYDAARIRSTGIGKVTLDGTGGTGASDGRGVEMAYGALLTSVAGDVQITGTGGSSASGFGVFITLGASVTVSGASNVTIEGTAADGSDADGVYINYAARVWSGNGDITITGQGGDFPEAFANRGIAISSGAIVQAFGTGKITIDGTAGSGAFNERGVEIADADTRITSNSGEISITGQGGAGTAIADTNNAGVEIRDNAVVESTAITGQAGTILIDGTGGAGSGLDYGVSLSGGSRVSSQVGDIQITGHGGASTGDRNIGVWITTGSTVTAAGAGHVLIDGTGGSGVNENNGIVINAYGFGGATLLAVQNGDLTLTGHGSTTATGSASRGIGIYDAAVIQSTGIGKVTLNGTGGTGTDSARGVEFAYGPRVTSATGDIQITGQGGANASGYGVWVTYGSILESTGTARITINGTAGLANDAIGVEVNLEAHISSVDGDVTIHGHGADFLAGGANHGLVVTSGAVISSTGTAKITLDGTGGAGLGSSRGVEMADAGTKITSLHGDISITGQGGASDSGSDNQGVLIRDGVVIESTATTGIAAAISIDGTGGDGVGRLMGIALNNSRITSAGTGNITLVGHAGDGDGANIGIFAVSGAVIESTGTGQISLTGVGGAGTAENRGIQINDASITSTSGDIRLTGQGGQGTQFWNIGVWLVLGANVSASGDARIFIDGTAGSGTDDNNGVLFNGFGYGGATKVSSENGDIEITGQGSTTGTGAGNRGICLLETGTIQSTGTGKITLDGTGGTGTIGARGLELAYDAVVTSVTGDIQITGQGGTTTSGYGAMISVRSTVESTGTAKITIEGIAGLANDAIGVVVSSDAHVSAVDGDVTIHGQGADFLTGSGNHGLVVDSRAVIASTGAARITLEGTAGLGTDGNRGIELADAGTKITSQHGDISITGHGGDNSSGPGTYNVGVWMRDGVVVQSTATTGTAAKISIDGTAGAGLSSEIGVLLSSDIRVSSLAGDVSITGQGGAGTGDQNLGVWSTGGSTVTAAGNARITIDGTGGTGVSQNGGVLFNALGTTGATRVKAENGDITITGHGSTTGTGSGNRGIGIWEGAVIQSTGTAKISLNGTGGTGSDSADGVGMNGNGTKITSVSGDIRITGQGGTSTNAYGLELVTSAIIESTGSARITIKGTGGTGQQGIGVATGYDPRISSVDGDITIIGQGGDALAGDQARGIGLFSGVHVESTGLAKISLEGTGGSGTSSSRGIEIADGGTEVSSANGDIQIIGQGGDNTYGFGIWVRSGALIQSTNTAKITLDGTGGASGSNDHGVFFGGYGSGGGTLTSVNGDISIIGHAGGTAADPYNSGVGFFEASVIESTGTARITIDGTGGNGFDNGRGAEITDSGTRVSSKIGDISITGHGGTTSNTSDATSNVGIWIRNSAVVQSTATDGTGAKITINGTAGAGFGSDVGVWMTNGGQVSSTVGDIQVTGHGASGSGIFNHGIELVSGRIVSNGAAKITVNGTAGASDGRSLGVYVDGANAAIQSVNGDIQIVGQGGTGGNSNIGVGVQGGGLIESTGSAKISISGTGGDGTDSNHGVRIFGSDAFIRTVVGDIQITGVGGAGTATFNSGVDLQEGGSIISTGTARINVTGTGGTGVFGPATGAGQVGVWVLNSNSRITSQDGDIQINGTGGGDPGTSGNHGVMLQAGVIETSGTANVVITGAAGVGSTSFGIQVQSDAATVGVNTSAGTGNITLISDGINIDTVSQPGAIRAGTNTITIHPLTNNTAINLGGVDASGVLGLTDAELDRVFAGALIVGDNSSGTITASADITRPNATDLLLVSGGNVVIAGGQLDTDGGSLLLDSGATPDVVNPLHAGVDVAATTTTLDGDLLIAINGSLVDTGYTQLNVIGGANLNGVKLQLSGSYIPQLNDNFIIVNNDGVEAIAGQFNGLDEGTIFNFNGRSLQITYHGGSDGNDVVLETVNLAPVAADDSITTAEDTPVSNTLHAADVDSPTLTYSIVVNPTHGAVNITNTATGAYTYTPDADYNGTDSFQFQVNDGHLNSNMATVSITIDAVNDAPQLNLNGGAVTFSGKAAKKEGPTTIVPNITVVDVDQPATSGLGGGTLTISIDASAKTTKNKVKLHDTIGGVSNASALGTTTGALVSNGKLVLTIQLNASTSTNDIQAFLRGITFSTKGPGLKLTPRAFHAQLTDAAGAASNLLVQTVNVTK
ncbi:MAG: hypothetical protein JWN70_7088 [Planctomycetaceae bacterium]|nr:hypothetical protein [Planctomycetaceae bacterium]